MSLSDSITCQTSLGTPQSPPKQESSTAGDLKMIVNGCNEHDELGNQAANAVRVSHPWETSYVGWNSRARFLCPLMRILLKQLSLKLNNDSVVIYLKY